ncbi:MAG: hypothetical protein HY744_05860 [Deltaproteobacteria bacterium]|nr:hypothetical protein [Deltaproteobacteria bacterium]
MPPQTIPAPTLLCLALLAAGCSTAATPPGSGAGSPASPASGPIVEVAPPAPAASATAAASADPRATAETSGDAGGGHSARPGLPAAFALIGGSCPPPADAGRRSQAERVLCTDAGRVAGKYADIYAWTQPPPSALVLESKEIPGRGPRNRREIFLDGDLLWVRVDTCAMCRRMLGWCFVGELGALTHDQLVELQGKIGIPPATPPPRTAEQWRQYYGR